MGTQQRGRAESQVRLADLANERRGDVFVEIALKKNHIGSFGKKKDKEGKRNDLILRHWVISKIQRDQRTEIIKREIPPVFSNNGIY